MQTNKNISLEKSSILKIGTPRSNKYSKVYEGKFIKNYHNFLIQNNFEEFKRNLLKIFLLDIKLKK